MLSASRVTGFTVLNKTTNYINNAKPDKKFQTLMKEDNAWINGR